AATGAPRDHHGRRARGRRGGPRGRAGVVETSHGGLMDAVTKVGAFLVVLGVLVVFHELGHYWVARWCKVKVLRFSIGFGRIMWSRRFGPDRTEWAVSSKPLGG